MDRTYVLLGGCVALTLAETGQPQLHEVLTQGQLFGERAGTAEHQPSWPYTATARGEVQLGFFGARVLSCYACCSQAACACCPRPQG